MGIIAKPPSVKARTLREGGPLSVINGVESHSHHCHGLVRSHSDSIETLVNGPING